MGACSVSTREGLERALATILEPMGVRALTRNGQQVEVDAQHDALRIRIALPPTSVDVVLEHSMIEKHHVADYLMKQLDRGRDVLFAHIIDHIAKHDRHPLDRMRDVEAKATALLEAMGALDDIRMPHGTSNRVLQAAYELRTLLRHKPGAVTWRKDGYGADPPEVVQTP
jgi:hypothetical protein